MTETEDVTILWDYYTKGQRLEANKPGIAIKDKKKICKLMDVKVPSDLNISVAEFEKLSKYKELEIKYRP